MTDKEKSMLEKSLTKSAKKAGKYWVRGMIGYAEHEQGFYPIESIPVNNPFKKETTMLKEVIDSIKENEDILDKRIYKNFNELNELKEQYNNLEQKYNNLQDKINKINEAIDKIVEVM